MGLSPGVATDNIGAGIGIGVAIGVSIGAAFRSKDDESIEGRSGE